MERIPDPKTIAQRLDRENDLLGHRISWVVASQAFLFTAYGISLNGAQASVGSLRGTQAGRTLERMAVLLPWTSIASLLLLYVTVIGGVVVMSRLRRLCEPEAPLDRHLIHGDRVARSAGLIAPMLIPAVFLLTWAGVLITR